MRTEHEGSTRQLIQLSAGYFFSYIVTAISVKYFTGGLRQPPMEDLAYLMFNTAGGNAFCLVSVLVLGWLHQPGVRTRSWLGLTVPHETPWIVLSGVCTAVIIPSTTLLFMLPVSVMVAMVIMRGSIIVISRIIDAVLAHQGLLKRRVHPLENIAVVFALLAVGTQVFLSPLAMALDDLGVVLPGVQPRDLSKNFDFVGSVAAMTILGSYILAYAARLYVMNVFKHTRGRGPALDNRGFFAIEQIAATSTIALVTGIMLALPLLGVASPISMTMHANLRAPDWLAVASGIPFGVVAFFSVFLFMFKGRTATFAGLVNRLTSLVAGTAATLLLAAFAGQKPPGTQDWVSFAFILIAMALLAKVEQDRAREPRA
jgi:hypothetical protein